MALRIITHQLAAFNAIPGGKATATFAEL